MSGKVRGTLTTKYPCRCDWSHRTDQLLPTKWRCESTALLRATGHQTWECKPQAALIAALNRIIRGWTMYHRTSVAKQTFGTLDYLMFHKLACWANYRHPKKTRYWHYRRYWRRQNKRTDFSDGEQTLLHYADIPIVRHVKVRGAKSPFDGDWLYWGQRLGRDPLKLPRVTRLLKRQQGRCDICGLYFMAEDEMEVHHQDGNPKNNRYTNLALLHAHCHD